MPCILQNTLTIINDKFHILSLEVGRKRYSVMFFYRLLNGRVDSFDLLLQNFDYSEAELLYQNSCSRISEAELL